MALHLAGKFQEAEAAYRVLPQGDPNVLQLLGVLQYQSGRAEAGLATLEQALSIKPDHPEALANLGVIHHGQGRFKDALACFDSALRVSPGSVDLLNKRGFVLHDLGRYAEAANSFRMAIEAEPRFVDAWFNLGNSQQELADLEAAERSFRKVLELRPDDVDAMTNLGSVLFHLRRPQEAAVVLNRSIQIRPTADAYHNLATAHSSQGLKEQALSAARTAIQLEPKDASHHRLMGNLQMAYKNTPGAISQYRKALELAPEDGPTHVRLGAALNQEGRFEEGQAVLANVPNPSAGMKIARALLVPVIPMSVDEIETARNHVLKEVGMLRQQDMLVEDPLRDVSLTNFYWSYHSKGELEMQSAVVDLYQHACPNLTWDSPNLVQKRSGKFRVGVVSAFLHRHTIGKLFLELVARLRCEDIEVFTFDCARNVDDWTQSLNSRVDAAYKLIPDLHSSRQFIADQNLDAVFYPEIGMDPFTYYLAYSRLAPLQFMTWGHPVSTALPNMDCFLSSVDLEREGSEVDYSERLVKFQELMTVFARPEGATLSRHDLGLPENKRLYVCPQSLFKLHPDFDDVIGQILRADDRGIFVLLTGNEKHWDELILKRFGKSIPDVVNRVLILGRLPIEKYLSLCCHADALLDTFYFGGGNSSLEAFSVGAPIVTWPGKMLRGRITLAQYRKMDFEDLIARDPAHYVELALRLAKDRDFHQAMHEKVLARCGVLFENPRPVEELRNWLRSEIVR